MLKTALNYSNLLLTQLHSASVHSVSSPALRHAIPGLSVDPVRAERLLHWVHTMMETIKFEGILRKGLANISATCWTATPNPSARLIQILSSPIFALEYETSSSDFMVDRFVTQIHFAFRGSLCFS